MNFLPQVVASNLAFIFDIGINNPFYLFYIKEIFSLTQYRKYIYSLLNEYINVQRKEKAFKIENYNIQLCILVIPFN